MNVQQWVTDWFVARGKIRKSVFGNDLEALLQKDYFEAGWLTSMEVVEFVSEIEQTFDIQFSDSDLRDLRFVTISGITELILARSAQTGEAII